MGDSLLVKLFAGRMPVSDIEAGIIVGLAFGLAFALTRGTRR